MNVRSRAIPRTAIVLWVIAGMCVIAAVPVTGITPADLSPTAWALSGLFAVLSVSPVVTFGRAREEVVILNEFVVVVALLALTPQASFWIVVAGTTLGRAIIPLFAPLEQMRRAPWFRHVTNVAIHTMSVTAATLVAALAVGRPRVVVVLAALAGGWVMAATDHLAVAIVVADASGRRPGPFVGEWHPAHVGSWTFSSVFGVAVGLTLLSFDGDVAVLGLLTVAYLAASRALLSRQLTADRLEVVVEAAQRSHGATTVDEIDAEIASVVEGALNVTARICSSPSEGGDDVWPLTGDGARLVVEEPPGRSRLTADDRRLVEAIAAVAGPERERLELLDRLREAEAFKSLVIAATGHDLGNRLTAARAGIETLARLEDPADAERREAVIGHAAAAVLGATETLSELIRLVAMERGSTAVQRLDGPALERFVDRLELAHDVDVHWDGSAQTTVHHVAVERAVENLLRNADRYHDGDGPIALTLTSIGDRVAVVVDDRGPGLPPQQVDQLFEPFRQVGTRRDRHGGVGLGLYLARGFTEAVGGRLAYEPRAGGGSRFTLSYPADSRRTSDSA